MQLALIEYVIELHTSTPKYCWRSEVKCDCSPSICIPIPFEPDILYATKSTSNSIFSSMSFRTSAKMDYLI